MALSRQPVESERANSFNGQKNPFRLRAGDARKAPVGLAVPEESVFRHRDVVGDSMPHSRIRMVFRTSDLANISSDLITSSRQ